MTKSMKTLFISYNGALEPLIQSQGIPYLKGLSEKGVKCFLLSFEKKREGIDKLKKELQCHGIKWYHLKYHKRPSLPATLFDMLAGIFAGLYIVISKNISIVHSRATVPAVMGYAIARLTGKKFIFDVRGLMAEEYADGDMWKRGDFLYKSTSWIEKKLLKKADSLIVITENIKEFLINNNKKKQNITVIPCCVDMDKFRKEGALTETLREKYKLSGKFVFLYIGSVGTWYLLEEMIDFFIAAESIINNAHFLILTHIDKDMVISACKRKKLSFNDITVDNAEFSNMPYYIKLADVGMFFIKPCFSKRASFPTKFAEYLACGLPLVINSGIGDTDKIVKDYKLGVVIDQFNQDSYLSNTYQLLELMKKKGAISDRCKKAAEDMFSLDIGVSKYFDVYRSLLCN